MVKRNLVSHKIKKLFNLSYYNTTTKVTQVSFFKIRYYPYKVIFNFSNENLNNHEKSLSNFCIKGSVWKPVQKNWILTIIAS